MTPARISVERLREVVAIVNGPLLSCKANDHAAWEAVSFLQDQGLALLHQLAERDAEVERLRRECDLRKHAVDRWVPCPDHRDKTDGRCQVCAKEAAERAREEAQRDAQRWEMLCSILDAGNEAMFLPGLSDTTRALETGGELEAFIDGNVEQCAAFLAASGGK